MLYCTGWGFGRVLAAKAQYFGYVTITLACRTSSMFVEIKIKDSALLSLYF